MTTTNKAMTLEHRDAANVDPIERILAYAREIDVRDYRAELAKWERELIELLARKPREPKR